MRIVNTYLPCHLVVTGLEPAKRERALKTPLLNFSNILHFSNCAFKEVNKVFKLFPECPVIESVALTLTHILTSPQILCATRVMDNSVFLRLAWYEFTYNTFYYLKKGRNPCIECSFWLELLICMSVLFNLMHTLLWHFIVILNFPHVILQVHH